jgi:transcriptional regulator with XRE-family HTH domain
MNAGQRIAHARKALDMNQTELAKKVGMTRAGIPQIESGNTKGARPENLLRICRAVKASPDWIVFGEEPQAVATAASHERVIDSEILADILVEIRRLWDKPPTDAVLAEIIAEGYARTMQIMRDKGRDEIRGILAQSFALRDKTANESNSKREAGDG